MIPKQAGRCHGGGGDVRARSGGGAKTAKGAKRLALFQIKRPRALWKTQGCQECQVCVPPPLAFLIIRTHERQTRRRGEGGGRKDGDFVGIEFIEKLSALTSEPRAPAWGSDRAARTGNVPGADRVSMHHGDTGGTEKTGVGKDRRKLAEIGGGGRRKVGKSRDSGAQGPRDQGAEGAGRAGARQPGS